jgi:ATP-dependent helicase/nuclease subunit A
VREPLEDTQMAFYAALLPDDTLQGAYINVGERDGTKTYPQPELVNARDALIEGMTPHAAFEHNGALVERARFYAIACDPRRSVAVEACAGAGKTWMLVSRMVRALLEGSAPHEILAITFTKKAAGEMRQRLLEWLEQFAHQTDAQLRQELLQRGLTQEPTPDQLQRLRHLHQTLLQGGRPVQIRTFHSWFAALVRSAPLQALADMGLPAQYELLENDAQAVALAWPRFQGTVAADPSARADYLAAVAAHGRSQTQKALESALSKRVEFALADEHGIVDASVLTFAEQFPAFAGVTMCPRPCWTLPAVRGLLLDAARLLGASTLKTCLEAATALEQAVTAGDLAAKHRTRCSRKRARHASSATRWPASRPCARLRTA